MVIGIQSSMGGFQAEAALIARTLPVRTMTKAVRSTDQPNCCRGYFDLRRQPDHVAGAALAAGARVDLLHLEAGLPQPRGEAPVGMRRPDGKHTAGRQAPRARRPAPPCRRGDHWRCATGRPGHCRRRAGSRRRRPCPTRSDRRRRPRGPPPWDRRGCRRRAPPSARAPRRRRPARVRRRRQLHPRPSSARAARSVKPMPSPPISIFAACGLSPIFAQASLASASSEPLRRLFISSLAPSMMENSLPRRLRRSSSRPPGTLAESSCIQGIMYDYMLHSPATAMAATGRSSRIGRCPAATSPSCRERLRATGFFPRPISLAMAERVAE